MKISVTEVVPTEGKRVTSSMDCPLRIGANVGIHELFHLLVRVRKRETVVCLHVTVPILLVRPTLHRHIYPAFSLV